MYQPADACVRFVGVPFSQRLLMKSYLHQRVLKLTTSTWQLGNGATWSYFLQRSCDATNQKGLQIKVDLTINYLHYALRYVYLVCFIYLLYLGNFTKPGQNFTALKATNIRSLGHSILLLHKERVLFLKDNSPSNVLQILSSQYYA